MRKGKGKYNEGNEGGRKKSRREKEELGQKGEHEDIKKRRKNK